MTHIGVWSVLIDSLFDDPGPDVQKLPGVNLPEWLGLIQHDYDEVDRMLLDAETIGG